MLVFDSVKSIRRITSKSTLNEDGGAANSAFENDSVIWRHKMKPRRQYSVSTEGSASFKIAMDGSVDKNRSKWTARGKYAISID